MLNTPEQFKEHAKIQIPLICGAMYPCSNPELVAAASEAGALGIIQPMSLVFAHGYNFKEGIKHLRKLTKKPVGFNAIIEQTIKKFENQMRSWIDIALEEGVRFFVTALSNPRWVVRLVEQHGGYVYHDVTERKWALKALYAGVKGLICVNNRAGGHAGPKSPQELIDELGDLDVPLICAGGIGSAADYKKALDMGYAGVQAGTRFIATKECTAHDDYKQAILKAKARDIALTDKISGTPCSIIRTPAADKMGLKAGRVAKKLLRFERTKRLVRTAYAVQSMWQLKKANLKGSSFKDYFQAGKSVETIDNIESVANVVKSFSEATKNVE